jgi:hypothetical protein
MRRFALLSSLYLLTLTGLSASLPAAESQTGLARIYIKSENGQYVPNARVYVYDNQNRKMFYVESSFLGAASLELPAGQYTVSSAITLPVVDSLDRFASSEAHIEILPQDTSSVVLTLHPILPEEELSSATLEKIGVADVVAQYQRLN